MNRHQNRVQPLLCNSELSKNKPPPPNRNQPLTVIKSIKTTNVVMEVSAFQLFVFFMLFVFIPQINLGVDKPLHQIAFELLFFSVDSPADVICEGDAKEN